MDGNGHNGDTKKIRMTRACVLGSRCRVKYGGEESEEFEVRTG